MDIAHGEVYHINVYEIDLTHILRKGFHLPLYASTQDANSGNSTIRPYANPIQFHDVEAPWRRRFYVSLFSNLVFGYIYLTYA